jgi:hypothetical protein
MEKTPCRFAREIRVVLAKTFPMKGSLSLC